MGESLGGPPTLDALRQRAIDHLRAREWAEVLALQPELERDTDYWVTVWGPTCAVAAHHLGHDDAHDRLDAVIEAGFHDAAMHQEAFADTFATEPGWADLLARMAANTPPPPLELLDWPTAAPPSPSPPTAPRARSASTSPCRWPVPSASTTGGSRPARRTARCGHTT